MGAIKTVVDENDVNGTASGNSEANFQNGSDDESMPAHPYLYESNGNQGTTGSALVDHVSPVTSQAQGPNSNIQGTTESTLVDNISPIPDFWQRRLFKRH